MNSDFFAPPAFKPGEAMQQLKRSLRDVRPLAERGDGFDLHGRRVVELRAEESAIVVRVAKRPALSPEFDTVQLKNSADVRRCVEDVKRRVARWTEE